MTIIDVYGKIEKTISSEKLKLYIANIPEDWKEEILDEMLYEIKQQMIDIAECKRKGKKSYFEKYTLSFFHKLIKNNIAKSQEYNLDSIESCLNCIVDNMIYIFFDYEDEDEDMTFFDWTTNYFDSRLCEGDYTEKLIKFINFINISLFNNTFMRYIYTSNSNLKNNIEYFFETSFKTK